MPELFDVVKITTNKASGFDITATAAPGTEAVGLSVANLPAGKYMFSYSFQITFSTKNQPAFFGATGDRLDASMFSTSSADSDELHKNRYYGYPFDWAGGAFATGLNFYKDAGLVTGTIDFCDITVMRIG